jgi:hypothetical protein
VSKVYGEPVHVWVLDGRPARFVWRGRLYLVLGVLDHWVVSREWWRQPGPGAAAPSERECWRVDAAPGPGAPAVTCELRRDAATSGWLLARVWD